MWWAALQDKAQKRSRGSVFSLNSSDRHLDSEITLYLLFERGGSARSEQHKCCCARHRSSQLPGWSFKGTGGQQWRISPPVTVTFYTVTLFTLLLLWFSIIAVQFNLERTEVHLNLIWVWRYSCQMWMLHWCLFCVLVHLKLEMKKLQKSTEHCFADVFTQWCHTGKLLSKKKKGVFIHYLQHI